MAKALSLPVKSLAEVVGREYFIGGATSLPTFVGLPAVPFTLATLRIILSTAVGAAIIGILETVLAEKVSCDSYRCSFGPDFEENDYDRSIVGLGVGNIGALIWELKME